MERILALMACMLPELVVLLEIFEVKRPSAVVVAVFCQALSVFPVSDSGDLFPSSGATNLLPLTLGFFSFFFFLLRSEACSTEVVALMPDFGQVFVKGRRPFWPKIFALMPDFGQVFVKGRRPFWPRIFTLMPDFSQVFVKGRRPFWP